MGVFPVRETHDPRPTGKLIAAKWKHEHLRVILISAILLFAVVVMFNSLLQDAYAKRVTVVDGGRAVTYQTGSGNVSEFLKEQDIRIGPFDHVSISLVAPLEKDQRIVIDRAMQVAIAADGKQQIRYTTEDTVGEALAALGVPLGEQDRVEPAIDAPVQEGLNIKVVRVRTETITTEYPIAFQVVKKTDASLEAGKEKIVTTGQQGLLVKKFERVFEDGKLVREQVVEETVAKPAVKQVIAIGTKKKAAPETLVAKKQAVSAAGGVLKLNGKTVKVDKVLENVTLTAYAAGPSHTGKSKGEPGYGVTASGTKVQEGRTIAVDPDVIPMGWWVYIEGFGFRRAEDTGSAVKGKKIDIYYDSDTQANKFGLKRGYTVYVIGPNKPTSD